MMIETRMTILMIFEQQQQMTMINNLRLCLVKLKNRLKYMKCSITCCLLLLCMRAGDGAGEFQLKLCAQFQMAVNNQKCGRDMK